jgi:hypothetical protein
MVGPVRRALQCHAASACPAVEAIVVEVALDHDAGVLALQYEVTGDLDRLRIPDAGLDPERLWAHTCAEVFLARPGEDAYVEHNLSPTGQVAAFGFSRYRARQATAPASGAVACTRVPSWLELRATVPLPPDKGALQISTTMVIEDADGELSYWALHHPGPRPDFHDRRGFVLTLP